MTRGTAGPAHPSRESVWDYPRPHRLEPFADLIEVVFSEVTLVSSLQAWRVLETSHPPTYYVPPEDIRMEYLLPAHRTSQCEWKGVARWYDVTVAGRRAPNAAWSYPDPATDFAAIRDHVAFYAGMMDGCFVAGERVTPQPGEFYGGWITRNIEGPFKGGPGTIGW
jgi:uncharacterized protein (DUF427 family)